MKRFSKSEVAVGLFVVLSVLTLGWISISLAGVQDLFSERLSIHARFSNVGSLKAGAPVKIAGVRVGAVDTIDLDEYVAVATLKIDDGVELPADTMASIETSGLLGNAHVALSVGAAEDTLTDGDSIDRTEPAVNLTELIGKYAFGSPAGSGGSSADASDPSDSGEGPLGGDPLE